MAAVGSRSVVAYDAVLCDVLTAFVYCLMMPMAVLRMIMFAGVDVQ